VLALTRLHKAPHPHYLRNHPRGAGAPAEIGVCIPEHPLNLIRVAPA